MSTGAAPLARTGGRVLVVDRHDRVLLLRGTDPSDAAAGTWWFTPGGGLDDGETAEQGALRELAEETGLVLDALGAPVWTRTAEFDFMGRRYRQDETFFFVRVDGHQVDFAGFTALERDAVHEYRWWSLADLQTTPDTVYPSTLAAELGLLFLEGPPAAPKVVGP